MNEECVADFCGSHLALFQDAFNFGYLAVVGKPAQTADKRGPDEQVCLEEGRVNNLSQPVDLFDLEIRYGLGRDREKDFLGDRRERRRGFKRGDGRRGEVR